MILEQEQPDEPVLGEIEHPEDAPYLINPGARRVTKAIEENQQETPQRGRLDIERISRCSKSAVPFTGKSMRTRKHPYCPEIQWDL